METAPPVRRVEVVRLLDRCRNDVRLCRTYMGELPDVVNAPIASNLIAAGGIGLVFG